MRGERYGGRNKERNGEALPYLLAALCVAVAVWQLVELII